MNATLQKVYEIGIIPVIAIEDAAKAVPLARALTAGGLPAAEVTFRTAAGEEAIRQIAQNCPEVLVGAGTVLTTDQVDEALAAGAKFIVTPGLDPEIFDMLLRMHYRGVVIEAFGAGGLHFIRRNLIEKLHAAAQAGMAVVVCSQCLYESSNFALYQAGQKALAQGVIQGYDMTTEAVCAKLMWILGQTRERREVERLFYTPVARDILWPVE